MATVLESDVSTLDPQDLRNSLYGVLCGCSEIVEISRAALQGIGEGVVQTEGPSLK